MEQHKIFGLGKEQPSTPETQPTEPEQDVNIRAGESAHESANPEDLREQAEIGQQEILESLLAIGSGVVQLREHAISQELSDRRSN